MNNHTPGPWVIDAGPFRNEVCTVYMVPPEKSDGKQYVYIHGPSQYGTANEEENFANAKLIAAAPDLLGALQQCFDYPKDVFELDTDQTFTMTITGRHLHLVRDALAKAGAA